MDNLKTTDDVVRALGGTGAVARLLGRKSPAISNWRKAGNFPPGTFIALQAALKERGLSAPPSLWRMVEAPEQGLVG